MSLYREADNLSDGVFPIPYIDLARSFYSRRRQTLIPFLGAGASLPSPPAGGPPAQAPPAPDPAMIDRVCQTIGVADAAARILVELAVSVAVRMQSRAGTPGTVYQRLVDSALGVINGTVPLVVALLWLAGLLLAHFFHARHVDFVDCGDKG